MINIVFILHNFNKSINLSHIYKYTDINDEPDKISKPSYSSINSLQ